MLAYGLFALFILILGNVCHLFKRVCLLLSPEIITAMNWKCAPWLLAGFAGYLSLAGFALNGMETTRI
jgi:hypothetical protein